MFFYLHVDIVCIVTLTVLIHGNNQFDHNKLSVKVGMSWGGGIALKRCSDSAQGVTEGLRCRADPA